MDYKYHPKGQSLNFFLSKKAYFETQADEYKDLGENIKAARLKRCLSVMELASRSRITRSTLYQIEHGKPTVSLYSFFNVLKALNLYDDVKKSIVEDAEGNAVFKRLMMIKESTKSYKL